MALTYVSKKLDETQAQAWHSGNIVLVESIAKGYADIANYCLMLDQLYV